MRENSPASFPGGEAASPGSIPAIPRTREGTPARLVTIFGSLTSNREKRVQYIFDVGGPEYSTIVLPADRPLRSIAPEVPAASWYERELHDQYGIEIVGHPDLRPLLFHENWPDDVHPLVDAVDNVPWSKRDYRFLEVQGEGIAEVAVGPVHAGIIEPGHFRFSVVGDTVLHLELRHFYTHKGTEKLFEGRSATDGVMLAESVSGDNCFAHAVCYSQAVEQAYGIDVPPRALTLRLVGLELERLVCHISDVGGLCTDVGFGVAAAYATRLKESLLRESAQCCGTRYWRGMAVPGGLRFDLDTDRVTHLSQTVAQASQEFSEVARHDLRDAIHSEPFRNGGCTKPRSGARPCGRRSRCAGQRDRSRRSPRSPLRALWQVPTGCSGHALRGRDGARAHSYCRGGDLGTMIREAVRSLPDGSVFTPRLSREKPRIFCRGIAPRGTLLLDGSPRRTTDSVSRQVSVVPELARNAPCCRGQHHRGLSPHQ